ncbi:AAA family ATPase [Pelomonas sp. APW6]|uniref:AAA family ATPase n=1 Tax=Roseateles subflavus TaxID=3053353 RepID=A0ABT7LN88_9BURK|nr:UvrD-helicase domain-containing protein [Pelomonas sp. APW6]MDL5034339.1 AAA family ATPase [Pelomonas sp. APW6]
MANAFARLVENINAARLASQAALQAKPQVRPEPKEVAPPAVSPFAALSARPGRPMVSASAATTPAEVTPSREAVQLAARSSAPASQVVVPRALPEDFVPDGPDVDAPKGTGRSLGGLSKISSSGSTQAARDGGLGGGLSRVGGLSRSAAISSSKPVPDVRYTDEQQAIIDCHDQLVVADAFAGCGKTTTAVGYSRARPQSRILYLVLNTGNAAEARQRFPKNVEPMTTHSLAWGAMKKQVGNRVTRNWKPHNLMRDLNINQARQASNAQRVLNAFFGSPDAEISEKHVEQVAFERDLSPSEQINAVALARLAWKRMMDPADRLEMPDDAYLKMYALGKPQLPYDDIIFDEAQDANPVTLQIVRAQQRAKVLCIGDRHQGIYQFRGAINAMEQLSVGATRFHLTRTHRFGPAIAEVANLLLSELKGETHPIVGLAKDGVWNPEKVTHLSRTNAQLFNLAAERRGEGIHWIGGPEKYRLELVRDAYRLYARDVQSIQDRTLREIGSWHDYTRYAEEASDGEAKILVKLVDQFGHDTPQLLDDIVRNAVALEADASMVLTTAHKSKGLEWDCVQLCDDFEFLNDMEWELSQNPNATPPVAESNLLYVAATRARKALTLNSETREWIKNLPRHREERRQAAQRFEMNRVNEEAGMQCGA